MTHIPIHADVECTDGHAGESTAVVINPVTRTLTHFAVKEEHSAPPVTRLVPVQLVAQSSADKIHLSCTLAELRALDVFSETHFIPNPEGELEYLEPYLTPLDVYYLPIEEESVPPGELAVRRGTTVEAADGYVGSVGEFVIHPETGLITHMVLQKGHVWGKRDLTVPMSAVDRVEGDTVYLKLNKAELAELPSIALRRERHRETEVDLIVWLFEETGTAAQALKALKKLKKEKTIRLHNSAVLTKDPQGKTTLKESEDMETGRGALFGAIAGGVIGLLGGPVGVVIGAAAGAATGGAAAHWIDMGFANDDLQALEERMQEDSSALVIVVDSQDTPHVTEALDDFGGHRVQQTLTDEMVTEILARRESEASEGET